MEAGAEGDDTEAVDRAIKELAALEEYCSGPEFLAAISDSLAQQCGQFDDREEDHPLEWYDIFQGYAGRVEGLLETFLEERGVNMSALADLCAWAESEAPHTLFSVSYLLAALDYQTFVGLMLDHKRIQEYEVPDNLRAARAAASGAEVEASGSAGAQP